MPSAHVLTDHDQIRRWAEERGARPACVIRTGGKGDPGMIRLDFPGFTGEGKLAPLSWDEWFKAFEDNNLALIVQDTIARGQRSNFNKLVSRDSVSGAQQTASRQRKRAPASSRKSTSRRGAAARTATARKTGARRRTAARAAKSSERRTRSDRAAVAADKSGRATKRRR
jgi:hypothetical protein